MKQSRQGYVIRVCVRLFDNSMEQAVINTPGRAGGGNLWKVIVDVQETTFIDVKNRLRIAQMG